MTNRRMNMKDIDTISKLVDETQKEEISNIEQTDPNSSEHSVPINGEIKTDGKIGSNENSFVVVNENNHNDQKLDPRTFVTALSPGIRWYANRGRRNTLLRKIQSEPSLIQSGLKKVLYFDNPVFVEKHARRGIRKTSFADVVTEIIQEPIKGDIHPFGRGPLYNKSLGGEQTQMHTEEGKLFMWVLATIIVLSVAVGVIVMSQMYRARQLKNDQLTSLTTNSTNEIG